MAEPGTGPDVSHTNRISDVLNWEIWHVVDVSTVKFAKNGTVLDELRSDGEGGRTATLSD